MIGAAPGPEYGGSAADGVPVSHRIFTWSNLVSFSRFLISFPILWLYHSSGGEVDTLLVALVIYGILSDYLDGWLARRTGTVSELGKALDPIADKTCAFVLFAYTTWAGIIPAWFFGAVVVRDALIMTGSLWIRRHRNKLPMAVISGKVSVNALAAYWLSAVFLPEITTVQLFFMGSAVALMIFSFIDYFHRFRELMEGASFN
ncbi:MAG: CDP-alcohol phosphatidyltransferase family protein [Balneolaceae bacterium]|nr:CDP-alcohol phosphatidyltransferase family protein [Balneolaceae bacterium]